MAPHSSTLAWTIPWAEEPGRLQSMGSLRVRHDFTFTFHFHALEKEMATHSSVLAWRIPGMVEPGGLPSMGLHSQTQLKRLSSSSIYFGSPGSTSGKESANAGDTKRFMVWSLGWKDTLEECMTIHSNILAWEIPWTEEPGGLQSMGLQRDTIEHTQHLFQWFHNTNIRCCGLSQFT